jgi:hypothetical protein
MAESLNLRCSALPLARRCPGSIRQSALRMNASHPSADDGTAAHAALRSLPRTNSIDWEAIPEIASQHGADLKETRMLVALGARLWNKVRDSFQGALTEVEMQHEVAPGVFLTGHADLLAISSRAMRVGDWKTGRKDADHSEQFKGYAVMALLATEDVDEATGTGLWVREGEIENYTLDRAAALRWRNELVKNVVEWDGVYHPGGHCALYCPRSHECEAANALARRDVAVIADKSLLARVETELAQMTDAEKVAVFQKADLVAKFAERVRAAVKSYVEEHGDIVANGVRLTVVEENRREVDPLLAWSVLEQLGFTDEDFAKSMTLGVSKLEKVVAEKAGKGNGARAVRELGELLSKANAVGTKKITKLQEKRT